MYRGGQSDRARIKNGAHPCHNLTVNKAGQYFGELGIVLFRKATDTRGHGIHIRNVFGLIRVHLLTPSTRRRSSVFQARRPFMRIGRTGPFSRQAQPLSV